MKIISQDGTLSVPVENTAFQVVKIYNVEGNTLKEADLNAILPCGQIWTLGTYKTEEDAKDALMRIHKFMSATGNRYMQL